MPYVDPDERRRTNAEYQRRFRQRRKDAGLCERCAEPVERGTKCAGCAEKERVKQAAYRQRALDDLYDHYGGPTCVCCGETEPLFLTFDHVNSDGAEHRRLINSRRPASIGQRGVSVMSLRADLKRRGWPPVLQVLCMNCNMGRERNGGVCPHRARLHLVA